MPGPPRPAPPRCSVRPEIPFGVAAAAANAPALVRARANAAMAAVRLPLHRGGTAAGAGATGGYGASRNTASWGGSGHWTRSKSADAPEGTGTVCAVGAVAEMGWLSSGPGGEDGRGLLGSYGTVTASP